MALITEIPIVTVSMFLYFFNQCQQLMDNRLLRDNVCSVFLKSIYDCKVFGLLTQHFFSISMIYISQKSHSGETPNFFLLECLARYDLWALIIKSCFVCWSGSCISMLYNQRKMYTYIHRKFVSFIPCQLFGKNNVYVLVQAFKINSFYDITT